MNKLELKEQITKLAELIYTNLHKLEYSNQFSSRAKEFLNSDELKQIHRIAYTASAYKGENRESLEHILTVAKNLMEYSNSAVDSSKHTYEAYGVEFLEHENEYAGICSVKPGLDWKKAMFVISHHFGKKIVFMVRETNSFEVALMNRWKMPVEDSNITGYHKCVMSVVWQMARAYKGR
ncbi:hypothetical protein [Bacillus gaemokensis]|uniref:Uncharacterized protein n=1 Tax=Bacillus gaemokensis TaxID=574375 RepID=A0A073K999_9BACI|nr:hypothetical protein [Bacillus gaemokensis]KEK23864.1 hypothetical protein BAGA_05315 [Bacillus gaemokensis]KYG38104.1 hypothetical protein AZF08_20350 [Bacillus gaemokensis]